MKNVIIAMASFIVFMLGMGFYMLYVTTEQPESNYYEKDLAYNQSMLAKKNAMDSTQKPTLYLDRQSHILQITFPTTKQNIVGEVRILKMSDQSEDKIFKLQTQTTQEFPLPSNAKGVYQVVLMWAIDGKNFELQEKFTL
jgi:hypothetical protein